MGMEVGVPLLSQVEMHESWVIDVEVYEYDSARALPSVTQPTYVHPVGILRRCKFAFLCLSRDLRLQGDESRAETSEMQKKRDRKKPGCIVVKQRE
jgi:hypothetical protein